MSSRRRKETRHLRAVVDSHLTTGRGSVLGPDTPRRLRMYVLKLECGHTVNRKVCYKLDESTPKGWRRGGGWQPHPLSDALPPPKRARCDLCPH